MCDIKGTIVEKNTRSGYVILDGTACNGLKEWFKGYIRIDYDDKEFSSNSISATAYGLSPNDSKNWNYNGESALIMKTTGV